MRDDDVANTEPSRGGRDKGEGVILEGIEGVKVSRKGLPRGRLLTIESRSGGVRRPRWRWRRAVIVLSLKTWGRVSGLPSSPPGAASRDFAEYWCLLGPPCPGFGSCGSVREAWRG